MFFRQKNTTIVFAYFAAFLFPISCGQSHNESPSIESVMFPSCETDAETNEEILRFMADFYSEAADRSANVHNYDVSYYVVNIPNKKIAGACFRKNEYRAIAIDCSIWKNLSEERKRVLIYHEMGHCALNKNHVNHHSIMHSNLLLDGEFNSDKEHYLSELFGN